MYSKRRVTEIIIGILLFAIGCISFYSGYTAFLYIYERAGFSWEEISLLKVFHNYNLITSMLVIISGIFLIVSKRIGWMGSIVMSFSSAILLVIQLFKLYYDGNEYVEKDTSNAFFLCLSSAFFITIGMILLHKSFIKKYQPTTRNIWSLIILFIVVLTVSEIL
ncbi:hypothetical protein [uncultured Dokdonia sp.]|uniref:hypothetical protein n=1 Tax=uncultured Dokdonia sp. TaxID=575653 RepID=UPI0026210A6D|nr:hypothetical protein [uncultured Dokdonia sp.]